MTFSLRHFLRQVPSRTLKEYFVSTAETVDDSWWDLDEPKLANSLAGFAARPRNWNWRQFSDRLTDEEWTAIMSAATPPRPALHRWVLEAVARDAIRSNGTRTIAGMQALVDAGLISAARRDEILNPAWSPSPA